MLHKLALAASSQTPSLIKEAIPSAEQQRLVANNLEQKARYMGRVRGVKVPEMSRPDTGPLFKPVEGPSHGGILRQMANPQIENIRMGNPTGAASSVYKKSPLLLEKEIQKAHGTVSQSPLKQLRHRTVGKAKGWWGGRGLLGGKWRNRAALLGGAGALGLGLKAYLDSNKTPQPQLPPPELQMQPEEGPQYPSYDDLYAYEQGYPKMSSSVSKYSPDAVTIPQPTAIPTVKPLGPSVGPAPTLKPSAFGPNSTSTTGRSSGGSPRGSTGSTQSSGSSSKSAGLLKRSDEGVAPLVGLGVGGVGGWALGKKIIEPALDARIQALQKMRNAAPIGAAAAGALLLAALTAMFAKRQARGVPTQFSPYDKTNAGFYPEQAQQLGQFYG